MWISFAKGFICQEGFKWLSTEPDINRKKYFCQLILHWNKDINKYKCIVYLEYLLWLLFNLQDHVYELMHMFNSPINFLVFDGIDFLELELHAFRVKVIHCYQGLFTLSSHYQNIDQIHWAHFFKNINCTVIRNNGLSTWQQKKKNQCSYDWASDCSVAKHVQDSVLCHQALKTNNWY